MKINITRFFLTMAIIFMLGSCEKESDEITVETESLNEISEGNQLLKDVSLLVGTLLAENSVFEEVVSTIDEVDKHKEIVSLSYLLGDEKSIKKQNLKALMRIIGFLNLATQFLRVH